jgi:dTDP-4-dehydrorhamnose reductase
VAPGDFRETKIPVLRFEHAELEPRDGSGHMRILVLGASGMAGHVVALYLREHGCEVETLSAHHPLDGNTHKLDVTDMDKLREFLSGHSYEVVVNCVGMLVEQSERFKDRAVYINAYLPHFLECYYAKSSTQIIHLSTDCVFSGDNPPYSERSAYDGALFYDRSKALGEIINSKDLTFRMSIIGPELRSSGIGLFNWLMKQSGETPGFTGALWTGITTLELARAIEAAIQQNLTGLYQLVPSRSVSKFELLNIIKLVFDRNDLVLVPTTGTKTNKVLVNTREDFEFTVSDYRTMVEELREWILGHASIYVHYARAI